MNIQTLIRRISATAFGLLLLAMPALADESYYPFKTHHGTATANAIATSAATLAYTKMVRLTCVTACYYALATTQATGALSAASVLETTGHIKATNSTTHFLPANTPDTHNVSGGMFLLVIQVTSTGDFHFTELSK